MSKIMHKAGKIREIDYFYKVCLSKIINLMIINFICVEYFKLSNVTLIVYSLSILSYLIWFSYRVRKEQIILDAKYISLPLIIIIATLLCLFFAR